jgi:hypothetical protein
MTSTPIKPYRLIHSGMLPTNVSSKFRVSWMPILKLMTSGRNNLPALATGAALDELYEQGLKRIKDIAEYICRPTSKGCGCCAIQECAIASINHDHPCFRQGSPYFVHNLCAQMHDLLDNDNKLNMYCSESCKEQG